MPEEPNTPQTPQVPPAAPPAGDAAPPAPPANDDGGNRRDWAAEWDGNMDSLPPRVREIIRKANEEAADYRHKKKAAEDAEKRRLTEAGEYKALYEQVTAELEPLKRKAERAESIEAFMAQTVKTRIEALPEQYRALVPKDEDPLQTLAWLDQSAPLLVPPKAPSLDAGAKGTGGAAPLTAEERAMAQRMRVSDEQFRKSRDALQARQEK